jgi:hypothetical protein
MKVNIGKYPKKSIRRKINVQIDKYDSWSLDHTLALIIYPALLQLKASKQGVPSEFVNDVGGEDYSQQDSFDFYKESHTEAFNEACKKWDEVLEKMIWSFGELIKDDYEQQYHHGKSEWDFVESDKMFPNPLSGVMEKTYQMVDKNPEAHWWDKEGQFLHEERMQEGFELFGKYFRNLWD